MTHRTRKQRFQQRGHATTETIVAMLALAPFLVGIPLLGKQLDIKHKTYDAARYSVWERTVYRSDGLQKDVAEIELEARDRTMGNPRGGMASYTTLRNDGVTQNVLWRDRAGRRLLAAAQRNGPQPVSFNFGMREGPVEVGRITVPQIAYEGNALTNVAMAAVGVDSLGFNRNSFATADVTARVRPALGELADRPFALRPSRTQSNRQPLEQVGRAGILSDSWTSNSEAAQRERIDRLVANERIWQSEFAGIAIGFLAVGGKGSPLYGEGQFGFGRGFRQGPDFTVPSTTLPGEYVYTPRRR